MNRGWWRRNGRWVLFWSVWVFFFIVAGVLATKQEWISNVGFLILGALVAVGSSVFSDVLNRPREQRDLARALYEELADRVARCCVDFERMWEKCIFSPENMPRFRVSKCVPVPPIVYPACAGRIGLLGGDAAQALIQFYYRLAAWERDLENTIADYADKDVRTVHSDTVRLLAERLFETLGPGVKALEALDDLVEVHADSDAAAVGAYDGVPREFESKGEGSLRDRIRTLITRVNARRK